MAFKYDKLSCGYHPDYCSTCSANDCHGPCVCPVVPSEPGRVCEGCGGTGCPKCGCEPIPQQTFLSHTRLTFPKCTCDKCPKKCPQCCRKRLPCDCLPPDECGYEESLEQSSEEETGEDMSVDQPEDMDIDEMYEDEIDSSGAEYMVNHNNSYPQTVGVDCKCLITPMDTSESGDQPKQLSKKTSKIKRKKRTLQSYSRTKPKRKRRRASRTTPKKRKSTKSKKTVNVRKKSSRTGKLREQRHVTVCEPREEPSHPVTNHAKRELEPEQMMEQKEEVVPEELEEMEEREGVEYEGGETGDWYSEHKEAGDHSWTDGGDCRITQKAGPCVPPPDVSDTPSARRQETEAATCSNNCEKPCMSSLVSDPCNNPRPMCLCNRECIKEFHMVKEGKCKRCKPREKETFESCKPCDRPVRRRRVEREDERDFCDDSEICVDDCTELFGRCPPERECPGECNTGECENSCIVM